MALSFDLLNKKDVIDGKIDLLSKIAIINYDNIRVDEWILIDDYSSMSIDLVAQKMLGDSGYSWVLIKFNRIDMPLAINIGDVIAIPNIQDFTDNTKFVDYNKIDRSELRRSTASFKKMSSKSTAVKAVPMSNFIKKTGNVIF